jgi:DNA-binding GntR family transcriptional regulator
MTYPLDGIIIDKNLPMPLYHQLALGVEAAIRSGAQPVGSFLASEAEIAAQFGMSRPTVRQAIGELVEAGLVTRQRGVGSKVVNPFIARPITLTSLYEDMISTGSNPVTTVLKLQLVRTPSEYRHEFDCPKVWEVLRLRSNEDGPIALMHNWVAGDRILTAKTLQTEGLYRALRQQNVAFDRAIQRVGAENATKAVALPLGLRPSAAVMTMTRKTYQPSGSLLEVGEHKYRADRYYIESSTKVTQLTD